MNAPRTRVQRHPVHGVLLLDKPLGLSSNQALQKAKWLLRAEKAGHTGTLDPLATGVLPVCFGAATKFSQQHLDAHKRYRAVLRLGQSTTTGDAEGEVVSTSPVPPLIEDELNHLSARLTGPQQQVPPMYSALKKDGKALYEYARAGQEVDRPARDIEIFELKIALPLDCKEVRAIEFDAFCSKGTYIRTLGEDMARALGTVGHLRALRRLQTGDFAEADCVSLSALEAMTDAQRLNCLLPTDVLLPRHTRVTLNADDAACFLRGMRRRVWLADTEAAAVFTDDESQRPVLLGSARIEHGALIPQRLLTPQEVMQTALQRPPVCAATELNGYG